MLTVVDCLGAADPSHFQDAEQQFLQLLRTPDLDKTFRWLPSMHCLCWQRQAWLSSSHFWSSADAGHCKCLFCRRVDPALQQAATALEATVDEAIGIAYANPQQAQTGETAVPANLTLLRRSQTLNIYRVALWPVQRPAADCRTSFISACHCRCPQPGGSLRRPSILAAHPVPHQPPRLLLVRGCSTGACYHCASHSLLHLIPFPVITNHEWVTSVKQLPNLTGIRLQPMLIFRKRCWSAAGLMTSRTTATTAASTWRSCGTASRSRGRPGSCRTCPSPSTSSCRRPR